MVKERFDGGTQEVEGSPKALTQARLAFDTKGRCIKDNHTNIIGRQQKIEGLLDSAREVLQKSLYIGEASPSATVEGLIEDINEALAP